MDPYNHPTEQGREDASDRPPFQSNLPLRSLLTDTRLPPGGSAEESALRQLAEAAVFEERSAALQAGLSDYIPIRRPPPKKRKLGYGIDPHDHFDTSLSFQTRGVYHPGSAPSSFFRPDPPAAGQIPTKRPRLSRGSDLDMFFPGSVAPHQAISTYGSLQSSERGMLPFPNPALQHHELQRNDYMGGPLAGPLAGLSHSQQFQNQEILSNPTDGEVPSGTTDIQPLGQEKARGGIFDDADSEDDESDKLDASAANANSSESNANNPSSGGIFDDAEEELSFVPPSYASETLCASKKPSPALLPIVSSVPPKAEQKIQTAIKPSPPKSKKPTEGSRSALLTTGSTSKKSDGAKNPSQKKKKPVKPTKRVLVARKERELATTAMAGKDDLRDVIDLDHCHFLGRECWIFTVQQLDCVLNGNDASPPDGSENSKLRRRELLVKVASSKLWLGQPVDQGTKTTIDGKHIPAGKAVDALISNGSEGNDRMDLQLSEPPMNNRGIDMGDHPAAVEKAGEGHRGASVIEEESGKIGEDQRGSLMKNDESEKSGEDNRDSSMINEEGGKIGEHQKEDSSPTNKEPLEKDSIQEAESEEAAKCLLRSWRESIEEWKKKKDGQQDIPIEKKFPLDGPIACLFPTGILNFLASVPIRSLYDFLCLKKTETGAIIAFCAAWRKKCGLVAGTPLALAKHVLGISFRVETAISSMPPPDKRKRTWVSDPIVVLTGAAREFLIDDRKVLAGKAFIETRTKDLANALMEWRTTKGLPPLKGSGKVAMVSGWKANVKEAIDLEEGSGKVLHGVNLQALVEEAEKAPIVKEEKKKADAPTKKKPPPVQEFSFDPRIPDVDAALHSKSFLQEVLDPKHFSVLQTAGIKTAVELFSAEKKHGSPLAREIQKALPDPSTFELVIFDWCQIVRKRLSGIRRVTTKRKGDAPPDPPAAKARKEKPAEPKKDVAPRPSKQELLQKDCFYSLSAVTQTFLKTLGIETAEAFMTSRTTDLSSAFVEWRAKHNMSILKGLGAIASVSGWKAQVRKMAKERGDVALAELGPGGVTVSPKAKPISEDAQKVQSELVSTPVKTTPTKPKPAARVLGNQTVLSCPDVLFGRPSKKLVVESARDPTIRFYFELSIRKKASSDIALFISYIGARKLTTVHSDYSRIHQRNFSILNDDLAVADVSLLVAKDLSKKIKKDPNSSSAAGKSIRVPFSSLENGCGLIELCKHDVWPLPCKGEAENIWPAVESFILQKKTCRTSFSSNVVVGKDENGRSQYFLFLKEPLEPFQTVEVQFCGPRCQATPSGAVPLDGKWRRNVEGMLSRLSRRGLRTILRRVTATVVENIDKKLNSCEGSDIPSDSQDGSSVDSFISRRRAHWIACKIISQLQGQETKGAKTKSGGADLSRELIEIFNKVAWTPGFVAKAKEHPMWTESTVDSIKNEIRNEFEAGILSSEFLNSSSRRRWCSLAKDLFGTLKPRIERFSGFLDPSCSQTTILKEIRDAASSFAMRLCDGKTDNDKVFKGLVMSFEEYTDGMPCASPSLAHVLQTSVEQAYKDALSLCSISTADIIAPKLQQVIATSETIPASVTMASSQKNGKDASKKPEEASFRTLEDVKGGSADVHQAWYIKFQLLKVLNALLSISSVLVDGGMPFKAVAMKLVESTLTKEGVKDLAKFDKSTISVLAGTPVTFPSEVMGSAYQPNPLPLFLGLVWPTLRSSHWRVEAGDTPSDVSFLPPGERSSRPRGDRRTRALKQDRTRSRIKMAKASNDLGLGFVPKLTKRLFINAVDGKPTEKKANENRASAPTVSDALARFARKLKNEMGVENADGHRRAELVVKYIRDAFDAFAHQDSDFKSADGKRPSDTAGCEHLARFVFVAPSILCQTQLPVQIVEDTTLVLKELAGFLALEHTKLFAPSLCPPKEVYIGENTVPAVLASCLDKPRSKDDNLSKLTELSEAILPEDRPSVTDFVQVVMSQVAPCRATQEDIAKKNRRIGLGYTGLSCKHCKGAKGEGRYFFTSIESMTTAATVIEKHIQKCTFTPPDIKGRMSECRSRHAEQRKHLGQGAQAAFFLRLWERLRSSRVRNTADSLRILEMEDKQSADDDATQGGLEFVSHVPLIEYIKATEPWASKPELSGALRRYYEGMDLGGRLFQTAAMPPNFSSEWLLTRVLATPSEPPPQSPPPSASKASAKS